MKRKLSPSKEDYLKTIYSLETSQGTVRVKDIAGRMKISMPSVTSALKNLEQQGLVWHPRYDRVGLTSDGTRCARSVYKRHRVLKEFLCQVLGIDTKIADKDACGMEHSISPETLERMVAFMESDHREQK
jgi:DtxR family Mn-dependent transcriptional regulator